MELEVGIGNIGCKTIIIENFDFPLWEFTLSTKLALKVTDITWIRKQNTRSEWVNQNNKKLTLQDSINYININTILQTKSVICRKIDSWTEEDHIRFRISIYDTIFEKCHSELSIEFILGQFQNNSRVVSVGCVKVCGKEREPTRLRRRTNSLSKTAI